MKRLILSATICALSLGSVMADRPVVQQRTQADNTDYEYVYVTGSNVPKKVKKRNIILIGTDSPVISIDQKEMQRNGNGQVSDMLRHYPGVQISGR